MSKDDRLSADEQASVVVVCVCVGMMSFGMLFYLVAKVVTHQVFTQCITVGCGR